jgi:hypothetical protein
MEQLEDLELGSVHSLEAIDHVFNQNGSRAASVHEELQNLFAELVNDMGISMTGLEVKRPNVDVNFIKFNLLSTLYF